MSHENIACLFPGQVVIKEDIFEKTSKIEVFNKMYELVCSTLNLDLLQLLKQKDFETLNKNEVSSLLSVLASCVEYHDFCKTVRKLDYFAGYSIGQWTALYAAGSLTFEELIDIVKNRAEIMNKCISENPSSMISVIGISENIIKQLIEDLKLEKHFAEISNYNCFGQYTLAVQKSSVTAVMDKLQKHSPKKLVLLPMSGGWHSSLLNKAASEFSKYLDKLELLPTNIPVIDNVTGVLLPSNIEQMKIQLAKHICSPVLWEKGINTLTGLGCKKFFELGYGNTLTKFGFFINRSIEHISYTDNVGAEKCVG